MDAIAVSGVLGMMPSAFRESVSTESVDSHLAYVHSGKAVPFVRYRNTVVMGFPAAPAAGLKVLLRHHGLQLSGNGRYLRYCEYASESPAPLYTCLVA